MSVKLPLSMLLLILLNGGLLATLGWRLVEGSGRDDLLVTAARESNVTFGAVDAPVAGAVDSIKPRAIFHQSRSFYVAPPPQTVEQPPPAYRLAGSMTVAGKQSAVLVALQSGTRTRVLVGDEVEGWTVAAIQAGKVILQSGGRATEITAAGKVQAGVTVVGAQASTMPAPVNGVRVLGNSSVSNSSSRPSDPLNQAPRLYRPPRPQT